MSNRMRRRNTFGEGQVTVRVEGLSKAYIKPSEPPHSPVAGHGKGTTYSVGRSWRKHLKSFQRSTARTADQDLLWALKDVSFELRRGDVLGIIGKNGSGKSTLLKILSGVTTPTEGRAELSGRLGSLLEVGTGFHPDLTGRENVFLSGSLLGVSRSEVASKLDEIVDFSGIGHFIDTPVKRYSSGMYVRLAYAVSAHLRSDILILDEVFAVGDEEFRRKSRAHIDRIARDGRTILFVSHDMEAVKRMCNCGLWLNKGTVEDFGPVGEMTNRYTDTALTHKHKSDDEFKTGPARINLSKDEGFFSKRQQHTVSRTNRILRSIETLDEKGIPTRLFERGKPLTIRIGYEAGPLEACASYFTIFFLFPDLDRALTLYTLHADKIVYPIGSGVVECNIPSIDLVEGDYSVMVDVGRIDMEELASEDCVGDATSIRIKERDPEVKKWSEDRPGQFVTNAAWQVVQAS